LTDAVADGTFDGGAASGFAGLSDGLLTAISVASRPTGVPCTGNT
jgi:hypothetical protein